MRFLLLLSLVLLFSCNNPDGQPKKWGFPNEGTGYVSDSWVASELPTYSPDEVINTFLRNQDETVYIINFWATWCAPCVRELPDFERITAEYPESEIKVVLVSLDKIKDKTTKLLPFLRQNQIISEVIHMESKKSHIWIDKFAPQWSGAIPATIIKYKDRKAFHEGGLSYSRIMNYINEIRINS